MNNNEYNILLNGGRSKKDINVNMGINVDLSANNRLLAGEDLVGAIDKYDTYLKERSESNRFRIILNIHPYCSNVLFNPITEIVKYEGSNSAICLNFVDGMTSDEFNGDVIGKTSGFTWNTYHAVRDTQLSNDANGFIYHCGVDIFNNHILRNKSFKAVNFNEKYATNTWETLGEAYEDIGIALKESYNGHFYNVSPAHKKSPQVYEENFNTIDDYMRDRYGVPVVRSYVKIDYYRFRTRTIFNLPMHLYQMYDVFTYNDSVKDNLAESNGWLGFSNKTILNSLSLNPRGSEEKTEQYDDFAISTDDVDLCNASAETISLTATTMDVVIETPSILPRINKVINSRLACEFIDMYPERELFSFTPNFNGYRKRLERNWDYCLTYPSKSVYKNVNVPFLTDESYDRRTPALKVDRFDENIVDDSGVKVVTIYSISQHGLVNGDFINLYKRYNNENILLYENAMVVNVVDKYIFQIEKTNGNISLEWVNLNQFSDVDLYSSGITINDKGEGGITYLFNNDTYQFEDKDNPSLNPYPVCASKWVSVDDTCMDMFFAKVVNGVECEYYLRQFTRLPNFKFSDTEVNDYTVNHDNTLIDKFNDPSKKTCDFENHISKIGFSNTNYADDVTQIVYTDDIITSYLKDNLGRPLSDIYLTIVKRNAGYKEWYGIDSDTVNLTDEKVEYSHCFGKNQAQFLLSDFYRARTRDSQQKPDVRDLTIKKEGLQIDGSDEIIFDESRDFYGDLCYYSPVDCYEKSIQNVMGRFNTVQREIMNYNSAVSDKFSGFTYDEVEKDENSLPMRVNPDTLIASPIYSTQYTHATSGYDEGYYYQMHYRIPVKDVSVSLSSDPAIKYDFYSMSIYLEEGNVPRLRVRTVEPNDFTLDERLMVYDNEKNEIYYMVVTNILTETSFLCNVFDEDGHGALGVFEYALAAINDSSYIRRFVILKKHDETPSYARVVKDGSCRYYWRNIVSNGIEDDDVVYPFTNGAFYINKSFNFFLRRQDPHRENLSYNIGKSFDYVPEGEVITDYYDIDNETYESDEINDCDFDVFKDTNIKYVKNKALEKINNIMI